MAPPKPKIPSKYANVAKKLISEPHTNVNWAPELDDLAKGLGLNIEERSTDLVKGDLPSKGSIYLRDNTQTIGEAGIFNRTVNGKTSDIENKSAKSMTADFEVSMDELMAGFKEPKAVEGSGRMQRVPDLNYPHLSKEFKPGSGVLMDRGNYTPTRTEPSSSSYPLSPIQGDTITTDLRVENANINEGIRQRELTNPTEPKVFANNPEGSDPHMSYVENIPAAVGGAIGAGVLLSSQNAEAKTDDTMSLDMSDTYSSSPKVDLLKKVDNNIKTGRNIPSNSLTENGNTSTIMDEIDNLTTRAKHNLGTFAGDAARAYSTYHAEKDALNIKAQEYINSVEATNQTTLSDDDKELMKDFVGVIEGSPSVALGSAASGALDATSKFNQEVLQPLIKTTQGALKSLSEPQRALFQEYAPSLAVLGETVAYPLIGTTGWNIPLGTINNTNTDEEINKGLNNLVPEARKLLDDKATILGNEAGQALLSLANGYAELPMYVIGGTSTAGLMIGGMANELFVEDSKDSNLARGAALGYAGGKAMENVIAPIAKQGLNLLSKVKLDPSNVLNAFDGKVTFDDNATHVKKMFQALFNKNNVDPLLMMTAKTATMMADDAALKVRPDVSDAFQTKVIAPQAFVLSIDAATGKPKLYGVKDGLYGELTDFVNPEGRPVLINQIAKQEWMDNEALRDVWNKLIDPKRKTPPTTKHGIDEWTPDVIPPENPALVFAWKQYADNGKGATEVYRAGSRDFNKDFLNSRSLVRVEYDGPDGEPTTGLGFWAFDGSVVLAPTVDDGIPGAIPRNLTLRQTRINPNVPPTKPLYDANKAWEVNRLTDDEMYRIVDEIKATQTLQRDAAAEAARGGMLSDGIPTPDKRPPAPFDNLPDNVGVIPSKTEVNFSFMPLPLQNMAKAVQKMSHSVNNAAGKLKLISDTVYGEKFKIDASIQAFSLRHYKRLTDDLNKQFVNSFKDAAASPQARARFNDQLRAFIEDKPLKLKDGTLLHPSPPQQLQPEIQQKVQKYVAERNLDYAIIKELGGTVPANAPGGNAELERMFALDYFEPKEGDVNPWIERMRKQQHVPNTLLNLLGNKQAYKSTKNMGHYDQVMGRMSTEMEMSKDYMERKLQISQLGFMKELADNTQASSPIANQLLGHDKQVDFNAAGMLKGKWVSEETYKAIYTYPRDQKMLQNTMLGIVNMIKFNKTVLNPTTWVKNIMGNVWGVMNSNIVSSWDMAYRMPKGIRQMSKDLKVFNKDVMANDASVHRVHETLKFGLFGAEFESSRPAMLEALDNLAEPIARTSNRTWGENLAEKYFKVKDATLGNMAHLYSKVDMATKYSLYVNGLERWGIDLSTNNLRAGAKGRQMASDLLGATVVNNFEITDDVLTEMVKREIVRRIHLSLPMVDRIGPVATALNKVSPITNPWLRTASELARITLQMPHRMLTEKGYAVNSLKTASFLGTILGVNKALRLSEGISDQTVDDAKRIAPRNVSDYMPGATATKFYAGEGKERGIVFVDMANGLIEPMQWFKGGEVNNGTDIAKRMGASGIDLITGGSLLSQESKDAQAALGLVDAPQNYGVPFWKQGDTVRYATDKFTYAAPQIVNNMWQLYSTQNLPNSKGVSGKDKLEQPLSMQVLKTLGIPVATMGSQKQKEYKIAELESRKRDMIKKGAFSGMQREGSDTGKFQEPYDKKEVKVKYDAEVKRLTDEIAKLRGSKNVGKEGNAKPSLLNKDNMLTKHL